MSWVNLKVGEFTPFVYGKAIKKEDQLNTGYPVYGSNGIYAYSAKPLVGPYAVIVGRKGSVGKVHLSTQPCWVSDTAFYIQFDSLEDANFTYYLLSTLGLEDMNTDAAVPGLNRDNAHRLIIKVPNTVSQRSTLIRPLMLIDNKITLNRQINQTLEAMAQALFKSWFVDFEPVKAKMAALASGGNDEDANLAAMSAISGKTTEQLLALKTDNPAQYQQLYDTAVLFPSEMVESELGEVPKGWEVSEIGSIVNRLKSKKTYAKADVAPYGATPVFEQGAGILLGFHNDEASLKATKDDPLFIFGDHTCITHLSLSDFDISSNVIPLKGKSYPTIWVYYAVRGKQKFQEYRRHWSELVVKTTVTPTLDIAIKFSTVVTSIHLQMESLSRQNFDLTVLRDTLLPKLLAGELLVGALEDAD